MPIQETEPLGKVHTKIVATVGPASRGEEALGELIDAGVDVFRLNFSHGTHEEHTETLRRIRAVAEGRGRAVAVLQDLGGPKIRLGTLPGDAIDCIKGGRFTLRPECLNSDAREILTSNYPELVRDLDVGESVLFADGTVAMIVVEKADDSATLEVTLPGRLRSKQGINLPGTNLSIPALTAKDLADLDWSAREGVEYVGLSFVRKPEDVARLRQELALRGSKARIVSKIEKPQAVDNLEAIIDTSDAIMVARGDLGVEMDVARVPAIQKRIIEACHAARVPVITATQMLNSMETSNRPTRAEATDVFNAVLDGTDAVMLSGETAIGQYPVVTVSTMSRIVAEAERYLAEHGQLDGRPRLGHAHPAAVRPLTDAMVEGASTICRRLSVSLLVVATQSGKTALAVSKRRHATPTLALAPTPECARAMSLYWGVTPLVAPSISDVESTLDFALDWARSRGLIAAGDRVLLLRGTVPDNPALNAILIREVDADDSYDGASTG